MQFVIEKSAFLKALAHVTSIVERRNTIPILSNILIDAEGGELRLKATDLDCEVISSVPATVSTPGRTTVTAHVLHDIVRKLSDGAQIELTLGPDDSQMTLKSGHSRFSLHVLPAEDFPSLSTGDMDHRFEITAKDLRNLIEKTRFAISTEETRYYLNGIFLHVARIEETNRLRSVATDGHRLAQAECPAPEGAENIPGIIVPRKTVYEIHKLIENSESMVEIHLSETKIRFKTETIILTSKTIDGTFPDYESVIPDANDKIMKVSKGEFASAVDRVSTLSSDKGRAIKLNIKTDGLTLSVHNPESGSATEEVAIDYSFDSLEIGFNARYLLDIAGQIKSDTAHFLLADPGAPTMIKDPDDNAALYVLMPMRV